MLAVVFLVRFCHGFPGVGDLFFFLINHVGLHGIVVVLVSHKLGKLQLFLQHGSVVLFLALVTAVRLSGADLLVLADVKLVLVFVFLFLVSRVIDGKQPPHDSSTTQIVDGQIAAPLVLVLEPGESSALARFLVAHQPDPDGLAVL